MKKISSLFCALCAAFSVVGQEVGSEMVDAELPDLSGKRHKPSDDKGKYILSDFWASWCGPCIAAMPELGEISTRYADRLTVVGINSDEKQSTWAEASERHPGIE